MSLSAAVLLLAALPQDAPTQDLPPLPVGPPRPVEDEPLRASDGEPVAPGRVPSDTTPEARARWELMVDATYASALPAIRSFDLQFQVNYRREGGLNKVDVGVAYLEADHPRSPFVSLFLERQDLVSMYGPEGTWLLDGETFTPMTGREYKEDLAQLREYRTLAGNLLGLVQPNRLRLVSLCALEVVESPDEGPWSARRVPFAGDVDPVDLPTKRLASAARGYRWLELRSPDLRVHHGEGSQRDTVYRARLALEPGSGEVRLAVLHAELEDGTVEPMQALLVEVLRYAELPSGHRVPAHLHVREVDPESLPITFHARHGAELGLVVRGSRVNPPGLRAEHFGPR